MIIVGLTGSIGMGKTTAGRMLRSMGLFVHESDQAVHNFLDPNGEAFENIALTFPECWDKKNRIIKKDILSDLIFNDFEKKRELENILHPLVRKSQKNFILSKKRLSKLELTSKWYLRGPRESELENESFSLSFRVKVCAIVYLIILMSSITAATSRG